jgi:hypothetical protein
MDYFELWEEEYECFNNKDFAKLVDLRTRDFMKDKSDFGLKIKLCEAYYLNEEYKRAFVGYSKLYKEDPENYDVIYGLLVCMKKLKININDFKWKKKPEIASLEAGIEDSYEYMKGKRKPRSVLELYSEMYGHVYLEFTNEDLLESLMRDQRFVLVGKKEGVFSKFKVRTKKPQ